MRFLALGCALALAACSGRATPSTETPSPRQSSEPAPDPNFYVFLLLGQSNMEGVPAPEAADRAIDPRVFVLAYDDCPPLGRKHDEWYPAVPPLHGCTKGVGPGDSFGKAFAAARPDVKVGLVPLAVGGTRITFFDKSPDPKTRAMNKVPFDEKWPGAYEWLLHRARLAQRAGPIRGILFHQGETDAADDNRAWPGQVQHLVAELGAELGLSTSVPFVAGELLRDGCCGWFNEYEQKLPSLIPSAYVVSSEGLTRSDEYHFDLPSQREFGKRYAAKLLELLPR